VRELVSACYHGTCAAFSADAVHGRIIGVFDSPTL
jgi:hypothetical protein